MRLAGDLAGQMPDVMARALQALKGSFIAGSGSVREELLWAAVGGVAYGNSPATLGISLMARER